MYGKLIVRYCQDNHVTYKEFAKLCGVNVRSIYRWINGSTIKDKATELKLCELLGVEIPQANEIYLYCKIIGIDPAEVFDRYCKERSVMK